MLGQTATVTNTPAEGKSDQSLASHVPQIAWKELKVGTLIGNGSYGDVYQGQWQGVDVAIKCLQLKTLSSPIAKEFEQETRLMQQCQFPNIVRLYGICTEAGHYAMIMEYMPQKSLRHRLQDEQPLSWSQRWQMALDIAQGLAYLHSRGILHRDLKSLNILLDAQGRAKISDFGLAKVKLEVSSSSTKSNKAVGSVRWRAPELFKRNATAALAADIYSLGMLLWELATRQLPFADASDEVTVISWIKDGEQEKIPDDCPPALATIIRACWMAPDKRPTAEDVVTGLKHAKAEADAAQENKASLDAEKSWHFDSTSKPTEAVKEYALIKASSKDAQKVVEYYQRAPVAGYDVRSVQVIYNPVLNRSFALALHLLQERASSPAFAPKWAGENNNAWRGAISAELTQMAAPFQDKEYPAVKLVPFWHGTKPDVLPSLFKTGYANLATTDSGFFGKGLYSAYEADYAYRAYSTGALLVNWVAFYSAYPVIDGDMAKLMGKANYQNYDAHFIPVVPDDPKDPNTKSFYPCQPQQKAKYRELVVFDRSQCLPRYLVELQPTLPKALTPSQPTKPAIGYQTEQKQPGLSPLPVASSPVKPRAVQPLQAALPVSPVVKSQSGQSITADKADQKPGFSSILATPVVASSPIHAGSSKPPLPAHELKLDAKEVSQFLQHVANAEYDAVEAWLAKKPEFVLCRGEVTDLSKRTFPNITPLQYALWALDWHMWKILLKHSKYLTQEEAARQWQELETKGTPHGKEASWQGLIDAYDTYVKAKSDWTNIWCKQVGGGQFLTPAHVGNEYFHPTRPMDPKPDFTTSTRGGGATKFYVTGLGKEFAWHRGRGLGPKSLGWLMQRYVGSSSFDASGVSALYATRRQQKAELVKTLSAALPVAKVSSSPQLKKA